MGNSREMPTYDKGVGIQVIDQPNPAGAAEQIINSFRNFSETTSAITQGITKQVADQQRETLKNNISNTYRQFSLAALKNPDQNSALQEFNENSKQYASGLMQQTDMFNKPYVKNLVDYYHNEHHYSIEKNAIQQNIRQLSVASYKNMNDATHDWEDAINNSKPTVDEKGEDQQFTASRALFADQLRNMERDATLKHLDPSVMGKSREELIRKYVTSEYLKRYQDHVEQGLGNQFISKMQQPGFHLPGMNDQEKYQVVNQMIRLRDQGKRGAHVAINQLQYQVSDDLLNIKNGGMPNQDLLKQVTDLDAVKGQHYKEQQEISQSEYTTKQATVLKSPSEKVDYIRSLYADIDYNSPEGANKRRIADASVKAIEEQQKELIKDPLGYIMKNHPAMGEAVNTYQQAYNADSVGEQHKYTPVNSVVPSPWDAMIKEQMNLGLTLNGKNEKSVRLLDPSRVNTMINEVMQASPQDKVVWMNKLNNEFGGGQPFKIAMKQLISAGLPRNYSLLSTLDPNSPDAAKIAESVSIPAADVEKELASKQKNAPTYIAHRSINDVFGSSNTGTSNFKALLSTIPQYSNQINLEYKKNMASDISQIANYYALTQNMSADEATSKAQDIMANRYNYTSIKGGSNDIMNSHDRDVLFDPFQYKFPTGSSFSMIRLPKEVGQDAVKSYADNMRNKLSTFEFNTEGADPVKAKTAIMSGHWVNDLIDDGLLWVDSNNKMWTDKNGHPYSFSFRDVAVGHPSEQLPLTKKSMNPNTQQAIDEGTSVDDQDDAIEKANQRQIDHLKKYGSPYTKLMKSIQDNKNA